MRKTNLFIAFAALLLMASCNKKEHVKTYHLVNNVSVAKWKGFLRTGYYNEGSIAVQSDDIHVQDGMVKSGSFEMPLSSLENFNLPTEELKEQLIHHLQSADFFNMVLHPNISYTIQNVQSSSTNDPEAIPGANYLVSGHLNMLGKSLPVNFPARIQPAGNKLSIAAIVKVDRTKWGITYASDPSLPEDQHILPDMEIELDLTAERN